MSRTDGWIAVQGQIVGTSYEYQISYYWDGEVQESRATAISYGFGKFGHDDFNVGQIDDGKLTWWGWMDEPLLEDRVSVAAQLGLSVPVEDGNR